MSEGKPDSGSRPYVSFRDLIATLLPEICRLGVATAAEVGIETAAERIRDEARSSGSVLIGHAQVAAWARARPASTQDSASTRSSASP